MMRDFWRDLGEEFEKFFFYFFRFRRRFAVRTWPLFDKRCWSLPFFLPRPLGAQLRASFSILRPIITLQDSMTGATAWANECQKFARSLCIYICWYVFYDSLFLGHFLVWGSAFLFDFLFFCILLVWRPFLVSGSALGHIALLEGVCWNIQRLCERAQCAAIPGI